MRPSNTLEDEKENRGNKPGLLGDPRTPQEKSQFLRCSSPYSCRAGPSHLHSPPTKVMGFSGFGKKARTFDLDAIFEQTRRTAIERSQRALGESFKLRDVISYFYLIIISKMFLSRKQESDSSSDDSSDSDSEPIGPPLPPQNTTQNNDDEDDDDLVGPPLPPGYTGSMNPVKKIPDSHEITLQHGTKTVSALALDPSGARLVTGGYDYDVRFWDFAGMDQALQAFRTLQPCECHQIKTLQYSNTGDVILVISGNAQAKVLDRDGFNVMECVKGDQYIVDMANTKGHTAMLNSGCWHPKMKEEFMTCSNDGTVRTWDVKSEKKHKSVFKPRSYQGKKVIPTCCTYSRDGKLIAAGCNDGTIQIWDRNLSVSLITHTHTHTHQHNVDVNRGFALALTTAVLRVRSSGHRPERSKVDKSLTLTRI
uniref:WD repeat-containing protein 70 n=1 Tax=Cynoglossus semilaevis TaxID=244447 RepID=A0A3P8WCF3_CYNSE